MGLFTKLGISPDLLPSVDWELIPAETFAIFESWGGRERVRSAKERFYYFYIDNWEKPATLCLMERGIKFARVLARIDAPQALIDASIAGQGKTMGLDKTYAISEEIKEWLIENVVDSEDDSKVIPIKTGLDIVSEKMDLPGPNNPVPAITKRSLSHSSNHIIIENEVADLIKAQNFYDSQYNPEGYCENYFVDNQDGLTVTDMVTGIMWQIDGYDITSLRKMVGNVKAANESELAGFNDWRLPTLEEALSIMQPEKNAKGLHLHPCFSEHQPFIFLAEKREPGGYWFCDYKQGTIFWASGTIPGGFGKLCRSLR
jgi:hypothetical protein